MHERTQLTWDVFKARYGTGIGALPFLYIPLVALYYACFSSILSNGRSGTPRHPLPGRPSGSRAGDAAHHACNTLPTPPCTLCPAAAHRMLYAFSRDDAMLGSRFWRRLMPCNKLPVNASWLMAALAFLMGLPGIYNQSAFNTISAASVVALTWSYAIPIGLRAWHGQHGFIPGALRAPAVRSLPPAGAQRVWRRVLARTFVRGRVPPEQPPRFCTATLPQARSSWAAGRAPWAWRRACGSPL